MRQCAHDAVEQVELGKCWRSTQTFLGAAALLANLLH
jgi:hypothetical protein